MGRSLAVLVLVGLGCSVDREGFEPLGDAGEGSGGAGGGARDGSATGDRPAGSDRVAPEDRPLPPPPPPPTTDGPARLDRVADSPPATPDLLPPDVAADATRLANGAACVQNGNCLSGFCADNVCCESRCDGVCMACRSGATGAASGLCRPEMSGAVCGPPSCMGSTRISTPRCNGQGMCVTPMAQPCPGGYTCENTMACRTACDDPGDCASGFVCDTAGKICRPARRANGQSCNMGTDCMSGACHDNVCCDMPCAGLCRACSMAKTGQGDGRCAPIMAGHDPDGECPTEDPVNCGRDGTCDGAGGCRKYAEGTICGSYCCNANNAERRCARVCASGQCGRQSDMVLETCPGTNCSRGRCREVENQPKVVCEPESRCSFGCCCPNAGVGGGGQCVANAGLCVGATCIP